MVDFLIPSKDKPQKYSALFPPENSNSTTTTTPTNRVINGNTINLTSNWRLVESTDTTQLFLSLECYDKTLNEWASVHVFNFTPSSEA